MEAGLTDHVWELDELLTAGYASRITLLLEAARDGKLHAQ